MRRMLLLAMLIGLQHYAHGQRLVFDREHFSIVNQNGTARLAAELALHYQYDEIKERLSDIQINIGSLVITEQLIFNSLSKVDNGLKNGLMVRDIALLLNDIYQESGQLIHFASSNPHLLIFAEQFSQQFKVRGLSLLDEVSQRILAEKTELLMNAEKRDALLRKISLELRVIRALVFSMRKSMFWAAQRSLFGQLNPFKNFVNIDKRMVEQIIDRYKTLKK